MCQALLGKKQGQRYANDIALNTASNRPYTCVSLFPGRVSLEGTDGVWDSQQITKLVYSGQLG